ncbi:MAG: hypothetical protein NC930_07420 [Candidatus Omnitrophica bacterium]|nr:hypothetical protein [Candidatus Omnitrophota bacterium]
MVYSKAIHIVKLVVGVVFYVYVLGMISRSYIPFRLQLQPALLKSLLAGSNQNYVMPGKEFEPFREFLQGAKAVSFLTDQPYGDAIQEELIYLDARSYLAPLILNPKPGEHLSIIYCSSDEAAQVRLQENGYHWWIKLSPGKGVAVKKS